MNVSPSLVTAAVQYPATRNFCLAHAWPAGGHTSVLPSATAYVSADVVVYSQDIRRSYTAGRNSGNEGLKLEISKMSPREEFLRQLWGGVGVGALAATKSSPTECVSDEASCQQERTLWAERRVSDL